MAGVIYDMAQQEIKLGDYIVNENSFPYIIAEIGINRLHGQLLHGISSAWSFTRL